MQEQVVTTDKLVKDLRVVVGDAEDLLKATASQTGERVEQVRARAEESLRNARASLHDAGEMARARVTDAARDVNRQMHENPWAAVGIAAGVGLILGFAIARR
jgi:ElaB/YqjD/DUF883 family membrane-anchored ribosome-binding protein